MSEFWILSDTHFGHRKMVELCGRPENFETLILQRITGLIKPNDSLIHCGDLAVGSDGKKFSKEMAALPVSKILIRGNHDTQSVHSLLAAGWSWACDEIAMDYGGKRIVFSHEPLNGFSGDLNIHGHLHNSSHRGTEIQDGRHALISMEYLDYRPISLKKVIELGGTPYWCRDRFSIRK